MIYVVTPKASLTVVQIIGFVLAFFYHLVVTAMISLFVVKFAGFVGVNTEGDSLATDDDV